MKVVNTPHQLSLDTLLEELAKLPTAAHVSEGFFCAARLIQESAYEHARVNPNAHIVGLIMLAAEVEDAATRVLDAMASSARVLDSE